MAFSGSNLVGGSLPVGVGGDQLPAKRSVMKATRTSRALPLQVRSEGKQELEARKGFAISRRNVMLGIPAGALAAVTLSPIELAEARTVKPETRRKILEKFERIREHFGLSKPKTSDGEEPYPSAPPSEEEKKRQALPPNPQGSLLLPPVEAILP